MDLEQFANSAPGSLVPIFGADPALGEWSHKAFVPDPLPDSTPELSNATYMAVAEARAALAALDSTARQLPDPTLLRQPTLRREAQSTSELEGTYAPLAEVLTADEDAPASAELVEILNYVRMATFGFDGVVAGWPLTEGFLSELQGLLMLGTPLESESGHLRRGQVVIGRRAEADASGFPAHAARFVPTPPGLALETGVRDLVDWLRADHRAQIDPVVLAAMSHYQFETLHPYRDGNGRLGRYLVVITFMLTGVLSEPTLTVSPWFEARRAEYYDRLFAVSSRGDWDGFVRFFAAGIRQSAESTRRQMLGLVAVQTELNERVRQSPLRAGTAHSLIDFAIGNPSFTVGRVQAELGLSYPRANKLISQLVDLGVLDVVNPDAYKRRFFAPDVIRVLINSPRAAETAG
ncbi:Fic family protein [Schumannella soli]|uniref:Fic family protein n=1 Tax=Schumannella soli TaxID=2590779 RepID=A0A506XX21_9MICO|nr:Fic/DOC family N-terminal domain-containing protein [Schumannella soli]TPW77311.1 Fic family protein [Schumannella soli]